MELSISSAYRGLCRPLRREGSRQHEAGARPCMAQPFCKLHLSLPSSAGIAMSYPAWAAEMSSSSSAQSSVESSTGTSSAASVGGYASQTVQSSVENAGDAASSTLDSAAGNSDFLVNILGTAAFLALALLTVGVVYLFVTDFLEKRKGNEEIKKLNEEASGKKKQGSSRSLMAGSSGGGKGFGRKRPATDDDE